jgi:hypothetical protein
MKTWTQPFGVFSFLSASLASLMAAGCSLPSKERWAQINRHGLLPVLIDGRSPATTPSVSLASRPSEEGAVRVQAVASPVVVRTPSAEPVPGRLGYAFSPHTSPRKVVDIRGHHPGEEVLCPYTGQAFLVPAVRQDVIVSRPNSRPDRPVTQLVSNSDIVPELDPALSRLEPVEAPVPAPTPEPARPAPVESAAIPPPPAPGPAATPSPTPAPAPAPVVKGRPEIPYGSRVAGRPGFVYSPFAGKTQLVDVAGTAPGVVVKCPYTNKLFRVPEVAGEEIKPSTDPTPNTADTPAPSTPEPTPPPIGPEPQPAPPSPGSQGNPQR